MNQSEMYEIPVAVGKEVAYLRVYRDDRIDKCLLNLRTGPSLPSTLK